MDLAFSWRHAFHPAALDLATLLARTSAAQAATPTARAQWHLESRPRAMLDADPRIALFGGDEARDGRSAASSFATMFSPRQPN